MLHCKIRITLASEVFHKKILCFAKASEVFEGIVKPAGACELRALGLLLADGTPTVGGGKTF